jgi:hypothetical protein
MKVVTGMECVCIQATNHGALHDLPASVHTTNQPNYCYVHVGSACAAKQTRPSCTSEAWPARALLIGCRP